MIGWINDKNAHPI